MSPRAPTRIPSDAVLTVPNLVTFARLALIPLFLWLALGAEEILAAFIVGGIAGSTDWIDGRLARRFNQVSNLGIAMDPFVDRLLIAASAVVLIVLNFAPVWAVLLVIGRDVLVLLAVPFLAKRNVPRPAVSWFGKAATMGVMVAFGMWTGAHITEPPLRWMQIVAWLCYIPGLAFSYVAAAGYARDVARSARGNPTPAAR